MLHGLQLLILTDRGGHGPNLLGNCPTPHEYPMPLNHPQQAVAPHTMQNTALMHTHRPPHLI